MGSSCYQTNAWMDGTVTGGRAVQGHIFCHYSVSRPQLETNPFSLDPMWISVTPTILSICIPFMPIWHRNQTYSSQPIN